jgi:hypothetical protein
MAQERDEREFRFLVWSVDQRNQEIKPGPRGIRVRMGIGMLVEQLVVNPIARQVPDEVLVLLETMQIKSSASLVNYRC